MTVALRAASAAEVAALAARCGLPAPSATTTLCGAWLGDALVGFTETRQILDEAELLAIGVAPERRGRGLGAQLLAAFLGSLTPGTRVFLEVREGNAPARALYARFGFVADGRRPGYYADGEAAILYSLTR